MDVCWGASLLITLTPKEPIIQGTHHIGASKTRFVFVFFFFFGGGGGGGVVVGGGYYSRINIGTIRNIVTNYSDPYSRV